MRSRFICTNYLSILSNLNLLLKNLLHLRLDLFEVLLLEFEDSVDFYAFRLVLVALSAPKHFSFLGFEPSAQLFDHVGALVAEG